ncbi:MAG: nicotinate-nucleotide adenylyltransferase [Rhodospirillaceae bacterium]|nr:nicotinate-nucleotide adenylyltransferase [Rhodospirillaceae bacterium]
MRNPATRWHPGPPSLFARGRIGLLGGSFNPAHEGHAYIARTALARLGLDEVWWLVSPGNPLKDARDIAPLPERFDSAVARAGNGRMRVTDIERELGTAYTAEAVAALKSRYPRLSFVWLMGADNLAQIPAWKDWSSIFHTVPVAVLARPHYLERALSGAASARFRLSRLPERAARGLARKRPPAWVFIHSRLLAASASAIRARRRGIPHRE